MISCWMLSRVRSVLRAVAVVAGLMAPAWAHAHATSNAYVWLQGSDAAPTVRLDVPLADVDRSLWLDRDQDGQITWGEVLAQWQALQRLVQRDVLWQGAHGPCEVIDWDAPALVVHHDGVHATLSYRLTCSAGSTANPAAPQSVTYRMFAQSNAEHRALLRRVATAHPPGDVEATPVLMLSAEGTALTAAPSVPWRKADAAAPGWSGYVLMGMKHLSEGLDHIVFLALLLVVCVLVRSGGAWHVRAAMGGSAREAAWVVTAFTLAHSLSLALAVAGIVTLPSAWVELTIALSVLITALDNWRPVLNLPRWSLAAIFGLAHGLGFAGPMQNLGLQGMALAVPLLGFNVGVELGQLVIVALVLPTLILLSPKPWYLQRLVPITSLLAVGLAVLWIIDRGRDAFTGST
jgi:hypothetical protein